MYYQDAIKFSKICYQYYMLKLNQFYELNGFFRSLGKNSQEYETAGYWLIVVKGFLPLTLCGAKNNNHKHIDMGLKYYEQYPFNIVILKRFATVLFSCSRNKDIHWTAIAIYGSWWIHVVKVVDSMVKVKDS